jgi:hypothetical protein
MAVQSGPLKDGQPSGPVTPAPTSAPATPSAPRFEFPEVRVPKNIWNQLAAVIAWCAGVGGTYLFIHQLAPSLAIIVAVVIAAIVQWLLTLSERPLWRWLMRRRNGKFVILGFFTTLVDGLLNAAGIYPYMTMIAQTDLGTMLAEVLRAKPQMDTTSAFLVALAIGLIVGGLPEALWES